MYMYVKLVPVNCDGVASHLGGRGGEDNADLNTVCPEMCHGH